MNRILDPRGEQERPVIKLAQRPSIEAVSYTHLDVYKRQGIEWARENPVGTGPFKLEKYTHGESIRYVKNEDYWQEGKPYLDAIEYIFMSDVMTQNAAMQQTGADSIDVLNTNSAEQIVTMENMPGLSISSYSIGPVSLIPSSLDESSPLSKLEVRQAIS